MTGPAQDPAVVIARSENGQALDVFIQAAPSSTRDDQRTQFVSMVDASLHALRSQGREALATAWQVSGVLPITALVQPPAQPFCACSLGLHAIRAAMQSGVWLAPSASPAVAMKASPHSGQAAMAKLPCRPMEPRRRHWRLRRRLPYPAHVRVAAAYPAAKSRGRRLIVFGFYYYQ